MMRTEMRRLKHLVGTKQPRMLDYGSGLGRWARAAVAEGLSVTAFEPSARRGSERGQTGFTVIHELAAAGSEHFDLINFEQVLEHLPNPAASLKEVHHLCRKDTIVRITVPNIPRCPEGRAIWQEWPYNGKRIHTMAPFEHLHGFTPASLLALAHRAGLRSLTGLAVWRWYPVEQVRRVLGRMLPFLGTTLLIAATTP